MDDELEPKKPPIDMESEMGMSRRDLLRRSAIVGGALLWAAPTIQTVGMKAAAAQVGGPSPGSCAACYCWSLNSGRVKKEFGFNGAPNVPGLQSAQDCADFCNHAGAYSSSGGAPGGPFGHNSWCSGTGDCIVTVGQIGDIPISPNPHCT